LKIPCSKRQGIFDRKECGLFYDSLAYPAASGGECARFRGSMYIAAKSELVKVRRAVASGIGRHVGTCNASASFYA
jgi:hypothetical protein